MKDEINIQTTNFLESKFHDNILKLNLEEFLLNHIDNFLEEGYIFSHIDEMNISTTNDKTYMTYEYYIQHPMPAVELKLNMIIAKNPHLIK